MSTETESLPPREARCVCGAEKERKWHLLCRACWSRIPGDLQNEVYAAYREAKGGRRHFDAIRRCLDIVRPTAS